MSASDIQYSDEFLDRLEIRWGVGFLSPGGADEVREIVRDIDLVDKTVLDIGCGTGGPALVLAGQLGAERIVAIDVEEGVMARARANAAKNGCRNRIEFRLVEPGPLPFDAESFDIVFSKDSIIHIPDKRALFEDILRVLRPGGVFAASDWLGGSNVAASPEWARFHQLGHLKFEMATADECESWMRAIGYRNVIIRDRNAWYAVASAEEVRKIEGPLREELVRSCGEEIYTRGLEVVRAKAAAVASGALRPTHLRGYKP